LGQKKRKGACIVFSKRPLISEVRRSQSQGGDLKRGKKEFVPGGGRLSFFKGLKGEGPCPPPIRPDDQSDGKNLKKKKGGSVLRPGENPQPNRTAKRGVAREKRYISNIARHCPTESIRGKKRGSTGGTVVEEGKNVPPRRGREVLELKETEKGLKKILPYLRGGRDPF